METLSDTAIIAAPTFRSRAYVQAMQTAKIKPARAYILPGDEPKWDSAETLDIDLKGNGTTTHFRITEPAIQTLEKLGVECYSLPSADINALETVRILSEGTEDVLIFSGRGGALLKPPILQIEKRICHVHGGWAPREKSGEADGGGRFGRRAPTAGVGYHGQRDGA